MSALLEVQNLSVRFPTREGVVAAVDDVSYSVEEGRFFGIAGESGSGKTMSALALLQLLPKGARLSGRAEFAGNDLLQLRKRQLRRARGRDIAIVFQDPMTSLHPMLTIERQITEHMRAHLGLRERAARVRAADLLEQVRLPNPSAALGSYPHQFSGGMRQRLAIAMALACGPRLLIADEPTTALDVTVQAEILRLLSTLREEMGLTVILITHDLGVMSAVADSVSIFYAGRIVESGPAADVLKRPRHPYTHGLLAALPHPEDPSARIEGIAGLPPALSAIPSGCAFWPRCKYASEESKTVTPPLRTLGERRLACHVDPFFRSEPA